MASALLTACLPLVAAEPSRTAPPTAKPSPAAAGSPGTPAHANDAAGSPGGNRSPSPSEVSLDRTDHHFVEQTAAEGQTEIALAQLANEHARDRRVRDYAQKLLQDDMRWSAEAAALAHAKNVPIENDLSGDRAYRRLAGEKPNKFDMRFLDAVVDSYKRELKRYQNASRGAKDRDIRAFADSHIDLLRRHLAEAEELRRDLED